MSSETPPTRFAPPAWLLLTAAAFVWFAFLFVQVSLVPGAKRKANDTGAQISDFQMSCFQLSNWFSDYWWLLALPAMGLLAGFGVLYAMAPPARRGTLAVVWLTVCVALPLIVAAVSAVACAG